MREYIDFKINLQLFGEKTEPATPKRREEMRKKGQIPKSKELTTSLILLVAFWSLRLLSQYIFRDMVSMARSFLSFPKDIDTSFTNENIMQIFIKVLAVFARVVAPILVIIAVVAIIVDYLQVGSVFTTKPLIPSINKLNPIEGFKRIFSSKAFVELLKSILKIGIIGYVVFDYLNKNIKIVPELLNMNIESTALFIGNTIINVGIRAGVVLFILSVFDYAYQIWEYEKSIKMSKQEIKDEYKMVEGNPQIKSKIREKQRQLALRRMMAEVPNADVIITNPTHFAIAVKYDAKAADAPLVIAKGKDLIAQKIKETAKQNRVPVVENKPLAQALYKSVDIGGTIPNELYKAVAEVLAYVYSLKEK